MRRLSKTLVNSTPGAVYTPDELADTLTRQALDLRGWANDCKMFYDIIDLAAGDGSFRRAIERRNTRRALSFGWQKAHKWRGYELVASEAAKCGAEVCDSLFTDIEPGDLVLGNPPWIGQVSKDLGGAYARKVAKRFAPYNAAGDLCGAFVLRAAELAPQISFLATKTISEGRTYRNSIQRLLLSKEWSMFHGFDPSPKVSFFRTQPSRHPWPGLAAVHYSIIHLVRVDVFTCFEGGMHYVNE